MIRSICVFLSLWTLLGVAQDSLQLSASTVTYTASDKADVWSGSAPLESLDLSLDPDDLGNARLSASLRPAEFNSGNFIRDTNARRTVFEVGEFPLITFELSSVEADQTELDVGENVQVTLNGNLSMHGVTQEITFPATVTRTDDALNAAGEFQVLLSDFEMNRPSFLGNTVADEVSMEFDISAALP